MLPVKMHDGVLLSIFTVHQVQSVNIKDSVTIEKINFLYDNCFGFRLEIASEKLEIFWKFRKEILNCREKFPTFLVIWFNRAKYWSQ